ncbi:MAG TPA: hypothetical protein VGY98_04185 [Verrucomicrobiae bacterium]|nr:hypothetical protein [Verrucomicrobiae bacterium]
MGSTAQNDAAVMTMLLFLAMAVACILCAGFFVRRRARLAESPWNSLPAHAIFPQRPSCWLAIRSATPERVRSALGLNRFAPCSWAEGMMGEHEFFISPRVNGWVIVTGLAIPTPDDDIDECFRFLVSLSRILGHVQFFHAHKSLHHHAWARLDDGYVTRAYAWADGTVWNQGPKTLPEVELGMKCFDYGEACPINVAARNAEKVARLAARWNFDPAAVDERLSGVAGEPS